MIDTHNLETVLNWMRIYGMLYLDEDQREIVRCANAEFELLKQAQKKVNIEHDKDCLYEMMGECDCDYPNRLRKAME